MVILDGTNSVPCLRDMDIALRMDVRALILRESRVQQDSLSK